MFVGTLQGHMPPTFNATIAEGRTPLAGTHILQLTHIYEVCMASYTALVLQRPASKSTTQLFSVGALVDELPTAVHTK
jgi:hypothetical protein